MSEIINNVAEVLMWDIFLMGVFTLLVLTVGAMWLFAVSAEDFVETLRKLAKKLSVLDLAHAAVAVVVVLTAVYYVGIISNNFSDSWIDESGRKHLFLKPNWLSDDAIKVKYFGRIYRNELDSLGVTVDAKDPDSADADTKDEIVDFYYYAKNKLWKDDVWKSYVLYSQKVINISRVWCLGFFLLLVLALLRFPVCGVRFALLRRQTPRARTDREPRFEVLCSLVVIALAIAGYRAGGDVWQSSEGEIDSKIFGVYRSEFGFPPRLAHLLGTPKDDIRMTELETDRPLDASGVAEFEGHLFIVNDKDNYLYVADPEDSDHTLKLIEVPKFGQTRAKFEDIAFHRESGYFYVTGPHYLTKPGYQRVLRFKLEATDDVWKPTPAETLPISDNILPYMSRVSSVEGLAVAGPRDAPRLYAGIRSRTPGRFTILEFRWEKSEFLPDSSHEIDIVPTHAATNVPYHLSGLTAKSESELLVLASSEDDNNGFHGNRIHTIDMATWKQVRVTREFEVAQKAEGIATWRTSGGREKTAIVFDNDREDTKQPSRLLVTSSINTLGN